MQNQGIRAIDEQPDRESFTQLLHQWQNGEHTALNQIMDIAYDRLSKIGHNMIYKENRFQTLQTQALVHEAYMRFLELQHLDWKDRHHFFSVWTGIMRRILIDRARAGTAIKRGGNERPLIYDDNKLNSRSNDDTFSLYDALEKLEKHDDLQRQIVELRYFVGLSVTEVAMVLDMSPATVKRKWAIAQAWLYRHLHNPAC